MGAFDLGGIEADAERRAPEEKLARIVARLVVDIDMARVVRRLARVLPPGIGEPAARLGHEQEVAGARMTHAARGLLLRAQHACHAIERPQHLGDTRQRGGVETGDHRDLMVRQGVGGALVEIGVAHATHTAHGEEARLAQGAVGENRTLRDLGDGIIAEGDRLIAVGAGGGKKPFQLAADNAEGLHAFRMLRPEPLEVVVEPRQVGEAEVRRVVLGKQAGYGIGDPLRAFDRGERPPIMAQAEGPADLARQPCVEVVRLAVAAHEHAAAVRVDRRRRNDLVDALAQALLKEGEGDGAAAVAEGLPDARPLHKRGGLFPEPRLPQDGIEEPVGRQAMPRGRQAGAQGGLCGAGECGEDGLHGAQRTAADLAHGIPSRKVVPQTGGLYKKQSFHAEPSTPCRETV